MPEGLVGPLEELIDLRMELPERLAHPDVLRPLAGKEEADGAGHGVPVGRGPDPSSGPRAGGDYSPGPGIE